MVGGIVNAGVMRIFVIVVINISFSFIFVTVSVVILFFNAVILSVILGIIENFVAIGFVDRMSRGHHTGNFSMAVARHICRQVPRGACRMGSGGWR